MFDRQPWAEVLCGAEWIKRSVATDEWPHYVWLQLVSRELLTRTESRFVEGIVHEDILWTLKLALSARRVGFCPLPLYGYRINPRSIVGNPSTSAANRRAQSYLLIMRKLADAAESQSTDAGLRRALFRHTNHEGGHFLGLMRKKLHDPSVRRELAKEFFRLSLSRAMFRGIGNEQEFWRAIRCWYVLQRCAASAA